jgi:hypothetical protein
MADPLNGNEEFIVEILETDANQINIRESYQDTTYSCVGKNIEMILASDKKK